MALVRVGSHRARGKLFGLCGRDDCHQRHFTVGGEFYEIPDAKLAEAREITGVTRVTRDPDEKIRAEKERNTARLTKGVDNLVLRLGGKMDKSNGYRLSIETKYGALHISPMDTWIATRFEDSERAEAIGGYTGKWNFHAHGVKPNEQEMHDLFESFSRQLQRILPTREGVTEPMRPAKCPDARKFREIRPSEEKLHWTGRAAATATEAHEASARADEYTARGGLATRAEAAHNNARLAHERAQNLYSMAGDEAAAHAHGVLAHSHAMAAQAHGEYAPSQRDAEKALDEARARHAKRSAPTGRSAADRKVRKKK